MFSFKNCSEKDLELQALGSLETNVLANLVKILIPSTSLILITSQKSWDETSTYLPKLFAFS